MKLQIREWDIVVSGLHIAERTERDCTDLARKTNDAVEARRAYVAAESYQAVREKIERENLG